MTAIILILVYLLGCAIYCIVMHNRIGTTESHYEPNGVCQDDVESVDIVLESLFWPLVLPVYIVLLPITIMAKLLKMYHEHLKQKKQ